MKVLHSFIPSLCITLYAGYTAEVRIGHVRNRNVVT